MNFRMSYKQEIPWLDEQLLASQDALCFMELITSKTIRYGRQLSVNIYDESPRKTKILHREICEVQDMQHIRAM
jgi:hypothetical protein